VFHHPRNLAMQSRSPEETRRLAVALSPVLRPGDVISLGGDLGAGKTTFVQGLAAGLGIPDRVTSPSFVLMKEYLAGRYPLIHMDVYRLERMQEVVDLGYDAFPTKADVDTTIADVVAKYGATSPPRPSALG